MKRQTPISSFKYLIVVALIFGIHIKSEAQANFWSWTKSGLNAQTGFVPSEGSKIVCDHYGNSIVVCKFEGPEFLFDSSIVYGDSLGASIFISKISDAGNVIWTKTISSGLNSLFAPRVAVDDSGYIFVCSSFSDSLLFIEGDTIVRGGHSDIFVAKYSPAGNFIWVKSFWVNGTVDGSELQSDHDNNIVLTFNTSGGTVIFDSSSFYFSDYGLFIAKLDDSGNLIFGKAYSNRTVIIPYSIKVDLANNIYISGDVNTGGFGNDSLVIDTVVRYFSDLPSFLSKFNPNGECQWITLSGYADDKLKSISVDNFGNIYAAGSSRPVGFPKLLISKYDSTGTLIWSRCLGYGDSEFTGIETNSLGELYVCGYFSFGPNIIDSIIFYGVNTSYDILIAKFDSSGHAIWIMNYGTTGNDVACSIGINNNDEIIFSGYCRAPIVIDQFNLPASGLIIVKQGALINQMENADLNKSIIYPNPTKGVIKFFEKVLDDSSIEVYNLSGNCIYKKNISSNDLIDLTFLEAGMYIYSLKSKDQIFKTGKIVLLD